ncbi:hypothetical protein GALMADRAFT_145949 [Galerina marginata CBS 339.88]|uniref:AMP-dependent synthetase/ligase domain-containing protein n=1 Tax=Galerina marginata (strain CBS 339.88) TaxID=685588 RepID=A0A067SQB1_GALM3|nr:hypothetical protein GALMADRAFT_145949 [Galerina marginata CBS 339.88]
MIASIGDAETCVFNPPPAELPLEFALDFHFKENPNHPALIYPTKWETRLRTYTYQELVPAVHRAGQWISKAIKFQHSASSCPAPVVMILLKTDTMTYLTVIAGLMRAGITAFPVSPRFSPIVVAHLLRTCQPKAVIFNNGSKPLLTQALEECVEGRAGSPLLCELPTFSTFYPGHNMYTPLPAHERGPGDISIITHSSSSSSLFPKVIAWSSGVILHHGATEEFPVHQYAGRILGAFGLELFHGLGMCMFFKMVQKGLVLGIMDPTEQTSILPVDPNDMFRCFELTQPDFLITNPRVIELWAKDPQKVAALADSSANIVYGGRFLSKSVGDMLVKSGVRLCSSYGATEIGPISLLPHFQDDDWEYWTINPRPDVHFIPRDDGLVELVMAPTAVLNYKSISNAVWDGKLAYNPGDLLIAHPTKENTYRMFGRSSDQIMLATGEMINPIELECELSKHALVSSAVMFGHSRFTVGIVIDRVHGCYLHDEAFIEEICRRVQLQVSIVLVHITKGWNNNTSGLKSFQFTNFQMVIVANAKKPIQISPKGLPRRPTVWLEYQDEMDTLYRKDLGVRR